MTLPWKTRTQLVSKEISDKINQCADKDRKFWIRMSQGWLKTVNAMSIRMRR